MKPRDRLRRTGILCCHCLRNIAFYHSWYKAGKPFSKQQFWVNANGNFLDIAVLEWCKLFGDVRGQHYYTKVVHDPSTFKGELLSALRLTNSEFDEYVKSMRTYRDKFVAHLDDKSTMQIPILNVAKKSVKMLYRSLLVQEASNDTFHDAPASASRLYKDFLAEGKKVYIRSKCGLTPRSRGTPAGKPAAAP